MKNLLSLSGLTTLFLLLTACSGSKDCPECEQRSTDDQVIAFLGPYSDGLAVKPGEKEAALEALGAQEVDETTWTIDHVLATGETVPLMFSVYEDQNPVGYDREPVDFGIGKALYAFDRGVERAIFLFDREVEQILSEPGSDPASDNEQILAAVDRTNDNIDEARNRLFDDFMIIANEVNNAIEINNDEDEVDKQLRELLREIRKAIEKNEKALQDIQDAQKKLKDGVKEKVEEAGDDKEKKKKDVKEEGKEAKEKAKKPVEYYWQPEPMMPWTGKYPHWYHWNKYSLTPCPAWAPLPQRAVHVNEFVHDKIRYRVYLDAECKTNQSPILTLSCWGVAGGPGQPKRVFETPQYVEHKLCYKGKSRCVGAYSATEFTKYYADTTCTQLIDVKPTKWDYTCK